MEEIVGVDHDEPVSGGRVASLLKRWGREPLLHFLMAGLALFAGYRALNPEANGRDSTDRIVLTEGDLRQLHAAWLAQGRPLPTPEDMRRSWVNDAARAADAAPDFSRRIRAGLPRAAPHPSLSLPGRGRKGEPIDE